MDRKRKLFDDDKMTTKRRKGDRADPTEDLRIEAPCNVFVPAAMDDKKGSVASETPISFPRSLPVSEDALVPPKEMRVNKVVYISPEHSLSSIGGHQVMAWTFKEGTVRKPATAVDHLRVLRNPTFGRRVDYGGVYDSDHHGRENLSPGFSNISDTYIRFLEKQTIVTVEVNSNPYAAWRVRGKSVDQIKAQIRWGNVLSLNANTWIAGHRNSEIRQQELNEANEYLRRAIWRAPNAWALPQIQSQWPAELGRILQARQEVIAENEAAIMHQMDEDNNTGDDQGIFNTLPDIEDPVPFIRIPEDDNMDDPVPSIEIPEDENMDGSQSSDFDDIPGYSDDSDTTDSNTDSDSDPEDLYSDDSSVCSSVKHSSKRSVSKSRPNFKRHTTPPPPSRPHRAVPTFKSTITDPYWNGVATNEQEDSAVREIIFRMVQTRAARQLIAYGYPAINYGQRLHHQCSWKVKPSPTPWGPAQEANMLNCAAVSPVPLIQLITPDGIHCELEEAFGELFEGFEYRRQKRDHAQFRLREKLKIYRSWHESRRERMLREEKEQFWEECMAKDAEMARVDMEELETLMGI